MKTSELFTNVRLILLKEWDPIGIQHIPEALAEYDGYVPAICRLLKESPTPEKIYKHLCWIASDRMGIEINEALFLEIAEKLIGLMPKSHNA